MSKQSNDANDLQEGQQSQKNKVVCPSYQQQLLASIFNVPLERSENQILSANEKAHATNTALNVYSNNFVENGIRALSISFPTVLGFIGEDSFRILAKKFLYHEPKTSFDWAEYGSELPAYIEEQVALNDYPFLSEVATLDWAIHTVQRLADEHFKGESFALLEAGDTASLKFVGAPGLQILTFQFPVLELYQLIHEPFLQSEDGLEARKALLEEVKTSISKVLNDEIETATSVSTSTSINKPTSNAINQEAPRSIVLWRPEYKAQFEYVSHAEADVIQRINVQSSVNIVIETIDKHQLELVSWLTNAISNKFIFAVA